MNHREKTLAMFNANAEYMVQNAKEQISKNPYYRAFVFKKMLAKHMPLGSKLLDYGCGQGSIAHIMAKSGYDAVGMEPAQKLLEQAKKLEGPDIKLRYELLKDEGESLPESFYDGIICSSALEFFADPDFVLRNFWRTLKPGGKLFITLPNISSLWRYYALVRFRKTYKHFSVQKNTWSVSEAKSHMKKSNFKVIDGPKYFESAFDNYAVLSNLNSSFLFGTLYMLVCEK